jgi:hypothetical protein
MVSFGLSPQLLLEKKTDGPNVSRFAQDSWSKDFISHPAEAMAQSDRRGA